MKFETAKKYFSKGIEIMKLNGKMIEHIANDSRATPYALLFAGLIGVAQAIGSFNADKIILLPMTSLALSFIGVGMVHFLSILFGGKAKFMELYRAMCIGHVGYFIAVVPLFGPILSGFVAMWNLIVNVKIIKHVHKLSTAKSIVVVAIPIIIMLIIAGILIYATLAVFRYIFSLAVPFGILPNWIQ